MGADGFPTFCGSFYGGFANVISLTRIPWSQGTGFNGLTPFLHKTGSLNYVVSKYEKEAEPSDYNFPPSGWEGEESLDMAEMRDNSTIGSWPVVEAAVRRMMIIFTDEYSHTLKTNDGSDDRR